MNNDEESTNAYVVLSVINTPTFTLPQTGGYGTLIFTLAGCGVALFAFGFVMHRKDKKEREAAEEAARK